MDQARTIFYLVPHKHNEYAREIVENPANRERRCVDLNIADEPCLRIGLDQNIKNPPHLARFGRRQCNDVILGNRFSRNDQCYFDLNKDTGELLLHDLSEKNNTELYDMDHEGGTIQSQIRKTPRQCVVVLSLNPYTGSQRIWLFAIGDAEFRLIPRNTPNEKSFTEERLAFAGQPDPERTYEGTMQHLRNLGVQSEALTATNKPSSTATYNPNNTRFKTPLEPDPDDVIRYTKLGRLGDGAQGEVHKVVDMHNGNHYACKIVPVRERIPELRISSARDFRARVEQEVNLVKQIQCHDNIVPYKYTQGFETGENIEIFMPVYEGSLEKLIGDLRSKPSQQATMATSMLYQILVALNFVHNHEPQIIHRDIKPANILYQGDKFLLTDFGIAKFVDTSRTFLGSRSYMAPEFWVKDKQTPKVDIYALGVTFVECLMDNWPTHDERFGLHWEWWHQRVQSFLTQREPGKAAMLADTADQRPTALQLLEEFPPFTPWQNAQANAASSSSGVSSPLTNQENGTTVMNSAPYSIMSWTETSALTLFSSGKPWSTQQHESTQPSQPNPAATQSPEVSTNRQQGIKRKLSDNSRRRDGSSHDTPSQFAGVSKRKASRRRARSKLKSARNAQEIQVEVRVLGKA